MAAVHLPRNSRIFNARLGSDLGHYDFPTSLRALALILRYCTRESFQNDFPSRTTCRASPSSLLDLADVPSCSIKALVGVADPKDLISPEIGLDAQLYGGSITRLSLDDSQSSTALIITLPLTLLCVQKKGCCPPVSQVRCYVDRASSPSRISDAANQLCQQHTESISNISIQPSLNETPRLLPVRHTLELRIAVPRQTCHCFRQHPIPLHVEHKQLGAALSLKQVALPIRDGKTAKIFTGGRVCGLWGLVLSKGRKALVRVLTPTPDETLWRLAKTLRNCNPTIKIQAAFTVIVWPTTSRSFRFYTSHANPPEPRLQLPSPVSRPTISMLLSPAKITTRQKIISPLLHLHTVVSESPDQCSLRKITKAGKVKTTPGHLSMVECLLPGQHWIIQATRWSPMTRRMIP